MLVNKFEHKLLSFPIWFPCVKFTMNPSNNKKVNRMQKFPDDEFMVAAIVVPRGRGEGKPAILS